MGRPKEVNYHEVALAFCYFGLTHDDPGAFALADKVNAWSRRPIR